MGAAAGVLCFLGLSRLGTALYVLTLLAGIALAVWAADGAERAFGRKDDGRIVIDEVVGQLTTLLPLVVLGLGRAPAWVVTGFVLFRVLDVWKPGPVRWAEERLAGGLGNVMDDVIAGGIGAALLTGARLALAAGAQPR